jgi:hypothetical protein
MLAVDHGAQPARPSGIDQGGAAVEGRIVAAVERAVIGSITQTGASNRRSRAAPCPGVCPCRRARFPSRRIIAWRRLALLSDSEQTECRCQAWSADGPSLASDRCLAPARWEAGTARMTLDRFEDRGTKPSARQRAVIVDPGDRRQLREVGCIRHHFRKRNSARKPCEESFVHSAVKSAVDRGSRHLVFK